MLECVALSVECLGDFHDLVVHFIDELRVLEATSVFEISHQSFSLFPLSLSTSLSLLCLYPFPP